METPNYEKLIACAIESKSNAYSPYSNFKVGAGLFCSNGKIYTGCNIENASYGATICAERVALLKAISEKECDFVAIAIASSGQNFPYPCGICRQVLAEFCKDLDIILINDAENIFRTTLKEIYPNNFQM